METDKRCVEDCYSCGCGTEVGPLTRIPLDNKTWILLCDFCLVNKDVHVAKAKEAIEFTYE